MRKFLGLPIILIVIFIVGSFWWNIQLSPISSDKNTKVVIIPKGEGTSAIAERLKSQGLIHSALAFKIYAKLNNLAGKIQAGSFKLSPSMNMVDIAKNLTAGTDDTWVTLIEGWRIEEMASDIAKYFKDDSAEFVTNAKEGYMFPDTYLFPKESSGEYIANTLKNTFKKRYSDELKTKIKRQGLTEEEGVILASLVEREGRSDKVRIEIAGILLKRLNMGMKLDVDATVQYSLGYQPSEKSWWKKHINNEDKKISSPYNTYTHQGLPPNPICNPGLASLKAVANANPNTPYLYYYHDSKGNSYYGKTLEEHLDNVANHP